MRDALLIAFLLLRCLAADTVNYTYDEAGRLARVQYSSGKTISYRYDTSGNLLERLATGAAQTGPAPTATAAGVVNAASYQGGGVAPSEIVTIFGSGIGPATLAGVRVTRAATFDTFLNDTRVLFDGVAAPLVYVSGGQTSAIVPYSVAGKSSTQMVVEYQGRRSAPVDLSVVPVAPALFSSDASGRGGGAILNENGSVNGASNAAAKGSIVVLYGTGEGQTNPPGVDGQIAVGVFPKPLLSVAVSIGGLPAEILYAGAAPGLVAGVFQINARISPEVASGNVPVVVTIGSAASQSGLTVAVR